MPAPTTSIRAPTSCAPFRSDPSGWSGSTPRGAWRGAGAIPKCRDIPHSAAWSVNAPPPSSWSARCRTSWPRISNSSRAAAGLLNSADSRPIQLLGAGALVRGKRRRVRGLRRHLHAGVKTNTIDLQILHDALNVVSRFGKWDAFDPIHRVHVGIARIAVLLDPFPDAAPAGIVTGEGHDVGSVILL